MEFKENFSFKKNLHLQTLSEAVQKSEEEIKKWTNFQKNCQVVLEGLETLPLELSVNCMIPIGKQALIEGKLKHTNEILVFLGEGYFVKYSAAQAIELTKRRIKHTQDMLIFLKTERDLFESRQNCPLSYEAFEDDIKEELIEHWNDQDLENWRVQHRQREKDYHEKKSKQEQSTQNYQTTKEQLFQRLDQLELEEELNDEYNRLHIDDDDEEEDEEEEEDDDDDDSNDSDDYDDDDEDDVMLEVRSRADDDKEKKDLISSERNMSEEEQNLNCNLTSSALDKDKLFNNRRVSFLDTFEVDNGDVEKLDIKTNRNDNKASVASTEVNYTQNTNDTSKINVNDSNVPPQLPDTVKKEMNSPADVHNTYFQPKSILKRPRDDSSNTACNYSLKEYSSDKYFGSDATKVSAFENLVNHTVEEKKQEHMETASLESVSVSKKKPISRFKLERINHK